MSRAQQIQLQQATTLDAAGNGSVDFRVPGNSELAVLLTSPILPNGTTLIPTCDILVNGVYQETTDAGDKDASDTRYVLYPGDTLTVRWTGGDPGAAAESGVRAAQYPIGQAPAE